MRIARTIIRTLFFFFMLLSIISNILVGTLYVALGWLAALYFAYIVYLDEAKKERGRGAMTMIAKEYPKGMTVKDLKEILIDWPETNSDGEPTEVWIETGLNLSSQVSNYSPLTWRNDLLIESNAFEDHSDE